MSAATPRRRTAARATACLAAATLLLPACAADDAPPPVQVDLTSEGFDPAVLGVPAGTEVRFINRTPVPRTVTSTPHDDAPAGSPAAARERGDDADAATPGTAEAGPIDSGRLLEGETYAVVLEDAGEYLYHAVPLGDDGAGGEQLVDAQRVGTQLVGTVRVEAGS